MNATVILNVRVPPELKEAIVDAAARSSRSVNAEVVARLERSLDGAGALAEPAPSSEPPASGNAVMDSLRKIAAGGYERGNTGLFSPEGELVREPDEPGFRSVPFEEGP